MFLFFFFGKERLLLEPAGAVPAAAAVLGVVKSAVANAEYKGLSTDDMVIATISASRGRVTPGHMARAHGRATEWNQDTVNLEGIIEEVE